MAAVKFTKCKVNPIFTELALKMTCFRVDQEMAHHLEPKMAKFNSHLTIFYILPILKACFISIQQNTETKTK